MNGGTPSPQSVRRPSQCDRLLKILADGRWHTTAEILRRDLMIVHSRISELVSRGHRIEHDGAGGGAENHRYRLTVTSGGAEQTAGLTAKQPGSESTNPHPSTVCSVPPDGPARADWGADGCRPSEPFEQLRLVA